MFVVKAAISGVLVALISSIARRNPAFGALIASLPLISILGMLWLWHATHDPVLMRAHVWATFWYVLPSLPMFLLIPGLMRQGLGFYPSLSAGCILTIALYGTVVLLSRRLGVVL
jgi:hypothetical protein